MRWWWWWCVGFGGVGGVAGSELLKLEVGLGKYINTV